ncbi:MAG: UDP-N-acetylmuramoyl-L-alanyl-D-glutamate--2,6-diaminopimelate ligase [Wenzhouxiangella sp.]|nr:MAG: UDP-N-acetylmuramoyl-L-alanyl-D-glutamate--2,6-diaminopimelate ligase [Wenzhouxiangella sp.]
MSPDGRTMGWIELLDGLASPAVDVQLGDLCLDSRQVRTGSAFVAVAGASGHGLDFLDQALAGGAVAVLHDGRAAVPRTIPVPVIEVAGLGTHLCTLARRFWGDVGAMDLVAVTGTNGKTSVAWLLAQALDGAMFGTLGIGRPGRHHRGTHTTPDVLSVYRELSALAAEGIDRVILEASSHALDQGRLAGLRFSSVIFTGLGHDHLDYHRDLDDYFAAKLRLFTEFESERQIVNLDDVHGRRIHDRLADNARVLGYTLTDRTDAPARIRPERVDLGGLAAILAIDGGEIAFASRLIGRINLHNLAIVALELKARGFSSHDIAARIRALEPVPGRMQMLGNGRGRLAVIDYAHTPDALENVLLSLRELGPERLWCVFGCGGERDRAKRPLMGRVAESFADRVILTDDNPRSEDGTAIVRAIQAGLRRPERSRVIRDRASAIRTALAESSSGDLVLVAGKGHETEQLIGERRLVFSDESVVRQFLEEAA